MRGVSVSRPHRRSDLERFYEIASEGRGEEIDTALARIPAVGAHARSPRDRAARNEGGHGRRHGERHGAAQDAAFRTPTGPPKQYLLELLVPAAREHAPASTKPERRSRESTIQCPGASAGVRRIAVGRRGARTGNDVESAQYAQEALEAGRALDNAIVVGRVLQRTALAAFYREDFDEAQDRALESARWHERIESHRAAATAYSHPVHHRARLGSADSDLAQYHARRMTMNAHLAGDRSLEHWGIVAQLDIAAESRRRAACRVAARRGFDRRSAQ